MENMSMKRISYLLSCAILMSSAVANAEAMYGYGLVNSASFDFVAPSVSSTSAVSDKQIGMIVFDASTNTFKGLDSSGNWDAMTISGSSPNVTSNSSGQERVERVLIANNGTASISSQSGTWVSSVSRTSTGYVTVTIANGAFTSAPTCVCSSQDGATPGGFCSVENGGTTTTLKYATRNGAGGGGSLADMAAGIICMGPH